ncbi:MAG: restriction endonuclease subunit S [Polaromonas sp.]|uniref:restriction endonuclease subunit S n=1 Tax=Polaromonas sp. TaxID=1869339 RepID=UPI0025CC1F29|nr:restriction endonuclease subunit S [Polaromonas sp.]MBI2726107.1 restriction endonuclease subunit S [Polaromonas sp.]
MSSKWKISTLAEITTRITDGSHNPPKGMEQSEFLMLSSKNVLDDEINFENPRYLSAEDFALEHRRTKVAKGDVLLTIVGTIGRTAVVLDDAPLFALQRSVAVIKPHTDQVLPRFLMLALMHSADRLNEKARGVAQKGIYLETLREFTIRHPSLHEQQRIVAILDEAFDGIATAEANAEKNLRNARALFESYLQGIFTTASETCELVALSELATDITDGDHMPPPKCEIGVPFITIGNINKKTRKIDFSDTYMVSHEYLKNLKPNRKPKKGDVLYTVTGSFGIPVLVEDDVEFCFQRHIGLVRPKPTTDSAWLNYLLLAPQVFKQADDGATGTAQKTVSLKILRNFLVPRVPLPQQREAVTKLDTLRAETQRLESIYQQKLAALDELKKSLLHQAFTGAL